jgi:hypothetical protein
MNYGRATFKLPFPNVEETAHSVRVRRWRAQEPKFSDSNDTRQNWKRFKKLCRLLKTDAVEYSVDFHFEAVPMQRDRWSRPKSVDGLRAEVQWLLANRSGR